MFRAFERPCVRAAAVVAMFAGALGCAQNPRLTPVVQNLERSQLYYSVGGGTVFEGQIAPQLIWRQTAHELLESGRITADPGWHYAWSLSFSPMVRLRMYDEASRPVRTPSYMPHFVWQSFWFRNDNEAEDADERAAGPFTVLTLQARLSHHSNGQDGCLFTTQFKVDEDTDDERCVFLPGADPQPENVNLLDGSFSTNFLRAGGFWRRFWLPEDAGAAFADHANRTFHVGAEIETHQSFLVSWIPGELSDEQAELYGTWRWRAHAGAGWRYGFPRDALLLDATFEHAPDARSDMPSWSVQLEGWRTWEALQGWGIYARVYHGQDFYNLRFTEEITRFHIGLGWTQERFDRFGVP